MKKVLAFLLAALLILGMLPAAFAEAESKDPAEKAAEFDYVKYMSKRDNYKYDKKNKVWSWSESYVKKYYDADVTIMMRVRSEEGGPNPAYSKLYVKVLDKNSKAFWNVESIDFMIGEAVYSYPAMSQSETTSSIVLGEQGQLLMQALADDEGEDVRVRITSTEGQSKLIRLSQEKYAKSLKEFCRVCLKYDVWGYTADKEAALESESTYPLTVSEEKPVVEDAPADSAVQAPAPTEDVEAQAGSDASSEPAEAPEKGTEEETAASPAETGTPAVQDGNDAPMPAAFEIGPYGIPLYPTAEDVDLAAVLDGHNIKRLVDLFGGIKMTDTSKQTDSSNKAFNNTYNDVSYYFLDDEKWLEPQYIHYYVNTPKNRGSRNSGVVFEGTIGGYVFNSDFYGNHPYSICISDSKHINKFPFSSEEMATRLETISLAFSSDRIKNITSAELVDGMYRICFEVTEGKSTTDFDCSVVIDPATSLIQSYTRSYYMPNNKSRLVVSSVVIQYGLDQNPDYSSMLSAIKK